MKNEFVSYEVALKLKELGFDEPCLCAYDKNEMLYHSHKTDKLFTILNSNLSNQCSTPLHQQVFCWFREKHNLYAVIIPTITMYWTFKTMTVVEGIVEVPPYNHVDGNDYPTYEKAEIESIKELMSIVKNKYK
jgi:hypothetical protein